MMRKSQESLEWLEAAMRLANPVPHPSALVDSTQSLSVSRLVSLRRQAMGPDRTTPSEAGRRWRGPAIAAAAMVAALAIGLPLLFLRGEDQPPAVTEVTTTLAPSTTTQAPTTAAATTTQAPTTTTDAAPPTTLAPQPLPVGSWVQLDVGPHIPDSFALTPLGWPGIGHGVWFSTNGISWTQSLELPHDSQGAYATVQRVVASRDSVIAVGFRWDQELPNAKDLVAWATTDGIEWSETILHEYAGLEEGYIQGLIGDDAGVILAVYEQTIDDESQPKGTSIWKSTDGASWTYVPFTDNGLEGVELTDIASIAGRYVSYGEATGEARPVDAADNWVFASTDGLVWEPAPGTPEAMRLMSYPMVTSMNGRVFVIGSPGFFNTAGVLAVWASEDGLTWEQLATEPESFTQGIRAQDVAAGSYGLLVAAEPLVGGIGGGISQVWASIDGRTWERVPDPDGLLSVGFPVRVAQLGESIIFEAGRAGGGGLPEPNYIVFMWTPTGG